MTTGELAGQVVSYFQRAAESDPTYVMAGLNLSEALVGIGQREAAIERARRVLIALESGAEVDPSVWEASHFPPCFDRRFPRSESDPQ